RRAAVEAMLSTPLRKSRDRCDRSSRTGRAAGREGCARLTSGGRVRVGGAIGPMLLVLDNPLADSPVEHR
nr:hypothetical protein [Tanacetum cinerariifolium]